MKVDLKMELFLIEVLIMVNHLKLESEKVKSLRDGIKVSWICS